MELAILILLIV